MNNYYRFALSILNTPNATPELFVFRTIVDLTSSFVDVLIEVPKIDPGTNEYRVTPTAAGTEKRIEQSDGTEVWGVFTINGGRRLTEITTVTYRGIIRAPNGGQVNFSLEDPAVLSAYIAGPP